MAAVCMAVYGQTWADLPGALTLYTPPPPPKRRGPRAAKGAAKGAAKRAAKRPAKRAARATKGR